MHRGCVDCFCGQCVGVGSSTRINRQTVEVGIYVFFLFYIAELRREELREAHEVEIPLDVRSQRRSCVLPMLGVPQRI